MLHLDNRMSDFCHLGNFLQFFYCCLIFVDNEKSPEILVQLKLGICDILESSNFSCTHIVHF